MTPKEALNTLDETVIRNLELKIVLSEAIKKQIPQKPRLLSYGLLIDSGWKHECPNCRCAIGKNKYLEFAYGEYLEPYEDYCPLCGQAIDWSDTE